MRLQDQNERPIAQRRTARVRPRRARNVAAAAVFVALASVASASAGATHAWPPPPMFPRETLTFDASFACTAAFGDADALPALQLGASYFVLDDLSLGAQVTAYGVVQDGGDTYAVGLAGLLRHHLFRWEDTTLFADVSFGPFEAAADVPGGGTRFNFVTRAGLGITRRLNDDAHLLAGARYLHLSNARVEGAERNPSINGVELYAGLLWSW